VLGKIENPRYWQWTACGKHPIAADYFYIGKSDPLMKALSDWVEMGYENISLKKDTQKKDSSHGFCSWRFWARVPKKDILLCGLLRESSDRQGRPYPLLIIGTGALKEWEKSWDLLPFACEKTWNQAENLSANMFSDLKAFENEVLRIKPPNGQWEEIENERKRIWESELISCSDEPSKNLEQLDSIVSRESEKTVITANLDCEWFSEQFTMICIWHFLLKKHISVIPNTVFMGGTPEKGYIVVFMRPLVSDDFIRLCSIHVEEFKEDGSIINR
jgi:type VI secretion system protein VasJ